MGGVISDTLSSTLLYVLSTPHVSLPAFIPPLLLLLSHYVPDMSTLSCQHMYSDVYCYIYSDIYVDMYVEISSDIYVEVYVDIFSHMYVRVSLLESMYVDVYVEGYLECTRTCACKYANW